MMVAIRVDAERMSRFQKKLGRRGDGCTDSCRVD